MLDGEGLVLESLELDGALLLKAGAGARVTVRGLNVSNDGWEMVPLPVDASHVREEDRYNAKLTTPPSDRRGLDAMHLDYTKKTCRTETNAIMNNSRNIFVFS